MRRENSKGKKHFTSIAISFLVLLLMLLTLSTSTFAWYSSINRARIHDITFTAASNDTVASDLSITWNKQNTGSSEISFNTVTTQLYPMIPKYELTKGVTTYRQFKNNGFYFTYQKKNADNIWVVGRDGVYTTPFVLNGTPQNQDFFYLVNLKENKAQTVTAYYSINGLVADQLKLALFVGDSSDENDLVLTAIMSESELIHYGELIENTPVGESKTLENAYVESGKIVFKVRAKSYKVIKVVAWLDGVSMSNINSENTSSFNIFFDGVEE